MMEHPPRMTLKDYAIEQMEDQLRDLLAVIDARNRLYRENFPARLRRTLRQHHNRKSHAKRNQRHQRPLYHVIKNIDMY